MEISQANSLARSLFFSISPAQEGGGGEERDPAKEDDSERVFIVHGVHDTFKSKC